MRKTIVKAAFIAVCVATCLACMVSAPLAVAETASLDFSRKGYTASTLNAVDFLEYELGLTLTDGEKTYLSNNTQFEITYNGNIASSYITTDYDELTGKLVVDAKNYTYIANNGTTVTWTSTAVNGNQLANGSYITTVDDGYTDDFVTVTYTTTVNIAKANVNAVLNQYYEAAKAASDKLDLKRSEYALAMATYQRDDTLYRQYLQDCARYEQDVIAYNKYLSDYAEWKRKDAPYQQYLKELAIYNQELLAYETYDPVQAQRDYEDAMALYQEYLDELEIYNQKYAEYLTNIDTPEISKALNQLAILDYMYVVAGENRTLRNALMGSTVASVLANKNELKLAGADSSAVDRADTATKNLRNLIENYEQQTTVEGKYNFYIASYASLKDNFSNLLRCLDYFYRINMIRTFIERQGKAEAYEILLAQLYYITNALDNSTVGNYEEHFNYKDPNAAYFNSSYRINGKTPQSIVGASTLQDTNDAIPLYEVPNIPQEPMRPTEVTMPTPPQRPPKPIPPIEVADPGPEPDVVTQPIQPKQVTKPTPPVEYIPTAEETALENAYKDGVTSRRAERTADYALTLTTYAKKYFRHYESVTVFFHTTQEANSTYYDIDGERGTYIEFPSDLPLPTKTLRGHTCVFDKWVYADGITVNWDDLRDGNEVHVYPSFVETPNMYPVVWVIDGKETTQQVTYGTTPHYDGTPTKANDANGRQYCFVGWDKAIAPMTDATVRYVAQFESSILITWNVDGINTVISVWKGETPVYPYGTPTKAHDSMYAHLFDGWNTQPTPATKDTTYIAQFTQTAIFTVDGKRQSISVQDGYYLVNCYKNSETDLIDISTLLAVAQLANAGIKISGAAQITISAGEVYEMLQAGIHYYTFYNYVAGYMEYGCRMKLYDQTGTTVDYAGSVSVTLANIVNNPSNTLLYEVGDDGETQRRVTFDGTFATFTLYPQYNYEFRTRYNIYVANSSTGVIATGVSSCKRNQKVQITVVSIPVGRTLQRLYAVDADGNEIEITNNVFTMPESDVTVFAVLGYVEYTVVFRSEGRVISRRTYRYGDTVELPDNPTKAPDGENKYVFAGWDSEVTVVIGDAEYNALFNAEPLENFDNKDGGMSKAMKLLIAGISVGSALLIAAAVVVTVVIVRNVKRRNASKTEDVPTNDDTASTCEVETDNTDSDIEPNDSGE